MHLSIYFHKANCQTFRVVYNLFLLAKASSRNTSFLANPCGVNVAFLASVLKEMYVSATSAGIRNLYWQMLNPDLEMIFLCTLLKQLRVSINIQNLPEI